MMNVHIFVSSDISLLLLFRIFQRQALNVKKAVVDLWQLAFSYQVNPLAAVQSSPAPLRGAQR